jgi:TonB family protein
MKTSPLNILSFGALLFGSLLGQDATSPAGWQSMKILQTVDPVYPGHLLEVGVMEGKARIVISTDATGRLLDWLVVGYTQPAFADAAVGAIKEWKFAPARLEGEAVGANVELEFNFEASGVVVTLTSLFDVMEERILSMQRGGLIYKPCRLRDLDRIPEATSVVMPRYPAALADQGVKGSVTVEFFIDEAGTVRMPTVSPTDNGVLTTLAVGSLSQWKFTPPTSKGRAVLVKASQVFEFKRHG